MKCKRWNEPDHCLRQIKGRRSSVSCEELRTGVSKARQANRGKHKEVQL